MTELMQLESPQSATAAVTRGKRRRNAYIVQANPSAPGLAAGLIKAYCLHKLGLEDEWNIEIVNFEGPSYRCLKDTLSGHYAIDGVFMLRDMYRRLDEQPPDVIAFSSYSWNTGLFSYMARSFRELFPDALMVVGGLGVFGHEESFLRGHPEFHLALGGEGEPAFGSLLMELSGGAPDFSRVTGLTMLEGNSVVKGPANPLMSHLDDIPSPILRGYVDILRDGAYRVNLMLETSRGCPMPCSFCLMSEMPATGRYHSFDYVREELDWVLAHGYNVEFADAIFHTNADRCNQILEYLLRNHNGKSKFNFEIFVEILRDDTIELMGEMARREMLRPCQIGLQSIQPQALKFARRPFRRERFEERLERFYAATDNFAAIDLIFGLPGDNYAGYLSGIDFVFSKQPFAMLLHHLVVIAGTAQERGVAEHKVQFDSHTGLVFKSRDWSRQDMDLAAEVSYAGRAIYNVRWWPLRILLFELAAESFSAFLLEVVDGMRGNGGYVPDGERILRAAVSALARRCDAQPEEPRRIYRALLNIVEAALNAQPATAVISTADPARQDDSQVWTLNRASTPIRSAYAFDRALFNPERYRIGSLSEHAEARPWHVVVTRVRRDIAVVPGGFLEFEDVSEREWEMVQWAQSGRLSWKELQTSGAIADLDRASYWQSIERLAKAGVLIGQESV